MFNILKLEKGIWVLFISFIRFSDEIFYLFLISYPLGHPRKLSYGGGKAFIWLKLSSVFSILMLKPSGYGVDFLSFMLLHL